MGILDGLLGNASENDAQELQQELTRLLATGERVEKAYAIIRDQIIFTNKRLILVDKQGVTGKKREILSVPYRSIERFSMETTGHFDLDAELKIWIRGQAEPLTKNFRDDQSIHDISRALAEYAL
ncbi:PH domain-containing protein [Hymenobacter chitinivorans]|uniref:PH (Pleckstrin Homology) domain-containing protein n=1 Tax=Hymenobacter chitinivorans DSM 11115 TaxID=1121954 RepID=A0A2M9APU2_9BACT|nr:PH domain-containing protein [Hymenobacter chitinivorans]PJJ47710.1 PH (Pleckstrin Homology) domain-containing protein [Hymenobacter chitinivorans DSM 11115]